jgi:hypothetical protein
MSLFFRFFTVLILWRFFFFTPLQILTPSLVYFPFEQGEKKVEWRVAGSGT